MNSFLLSVIVPCYNEAKNIPLLVEKLSVVLKPYRYEIILVNDGSVDQTQETIELLSIKKEQVKFISFSRNFGHQKAIKAGVDFALGNGIVTMDADLQHPPETILEMINLWKQGYDVVTAVRTSQVQPSWFKKYTSKSFYWLLSKISNQNVIANSSDFRLFDQKIAKQLRQMPEQDLYLRGLIPWIGFKQTTLNYVEAGRVFGTTKYTLKDMMCLASHGITSSSIKPLQLALTVGVLFALLAFGYGVYAIVTMFLGLTVSGWASIVASIMFLSGIQLIVLGVIGEYLGKLYMAHKHRPSYIIANTNIVTSKLLIIQQERRVEVS